MPARATATNRASRTNPQNAVARATAVGRVSVTGGSDDDDMKYLGEVIVGAGGVANVDFNVASLVSATGLSFRHLQLFFTARSETAGDKQLRAQFNSDTGGNYDTQFLLGFDASISTVEQNGAASLRLGTIPGSDQLANSPGIGSYFIPYYARTNFNKGGFQPGGAVLTTTLILATLFDNGWRNAAAITDIRIFASADDIAENSEFSLYGIT